MMYLRQILFSLIFLGSMIPVEATHFMGASITYECFGSCNYRVYHYNYLDCSSPATPPIATPPTNVVLSSYNGDSSACVAPTLIDFWQLFSYTEITTVCPGVQTLCSSSTTAPINGVAEFIYYLDLSFCNTNCDIYTISLAYCCRTSTITSGAASKGLETNRTIIDRSITPCNNSPVFNSPPTPYICAGQSKTYSHAATDPEGDMLKYSLGPCYASSSQVLYNTGYSPTSPLGSSWGVQIDSLTGDITFDPIPNPGGGNIVAGVLCVYVSEFRNGIKIGEISRDMEVNVLTCTGSPPIINPIQDLVINKQSVTPLSSFALNACVGDSLCFELPTVNPDTSFNLTFYWDSALSGATFADLNNPFIQDTLIAKEPIALFCWTPTSPGFHTFVATVKHNNCTVQLFDQRTITINVSGLASPSASVVFDSCNEVSFAALPGNVSSSNYTYQWSGNSTLPFNPSLQDSSFTHVYPSTGTYSWSLVINGSLVCPSTITGNVDVLAGTMADAGPPVSACSGNYYQLGATPLAGHTYVWTPATGLNNPTVANPVFQLTNTGLSPDTIHFVLEADNGNCVAYDSTTVVVYPIPQVAVTPSALSICAGDSIVLTASGGNTYQWSTGDTSQSIVVFPTTNSNYSVVSTNNNCTSIPVYSNITVNQLPVVNITVGGLTTQDSLFTANNFVTYQWYFSNSSGQNLSPIANATNYYWPFADYYPLAGNTGYVVVSATDSNQCTGYSGVYTLPILLNNESDLLNRIKLYPNPFEEELILNYQLSTPAYLEISICDLIGKSHYFSGKGAEQVEGSIRIQTEGLSSGIYMLQIKAGNEVYHQKIIKK